MSKAANLRDAGHAGPGLGTALHPPPTHLGLEATVGGHLDCGQHSPWSHDH